MSINSESPEPTAPPTSGDAAPPTSADPAPPTSGDAAPPAAGYPAAAPPAPQPGTNGLAVAGLILAFLMAPIGFILSLIALFQIGKRRQKGKGLAIAGLIVSVLAMVSTITVIAVVLATVGKNVATLADPGCMSGKAVIMNTASMSSDPLAVKVELQTTIDGLNAAAARATHDDVRNAMTALAGDYNQLLQAINAGTQPPAELEKKIETDANKIDDLCTIGGAGK